MPYRLKGCKRCIGGDLYLEVNVGSQEWVCYQCGWRCDRRMIDRIEPPPKPEKRVYNIRVRR